MNGGAWWATVHGVMKSQTWLSNFTFNFSLSCIGEGNGNPLQWVAWRIPGKAEPGGLPFMGSHRVGHDWRDLAAVAAAALGIIPVVIVRVFIFIKTETKNVEKNSNIQITTWSFAVVKEIVLVLCLNIYFSLELCLNFTMGPQQPEFRTTQSCFRQAFIFSFAKREETQ